MNHQDDHNDTTPAAGPSLKDMALLVLRPLASLQLTVVLFALSLVLVFYGTMAQMNEGIWTVVDKYFRSDVVWIPNNLTCQFLQTFFNFDKDAKWDGSLPFPGGWTLGAVMLANLLAAHIVRFRMTWKRSGIFVLHAGVIVLMVGELVTGMYAVESTMTMSLGETADFVDETLTTELIVSKPLNDGDDQVIKVPGWMLKNKGRISDPQLPVDIEVLDYWKNSKLEEKTGPQQPDPSWEKALNGNWYKVTFRPEEAGVEGGQRGDAPTVSVRLLKKGTSEAIGEYQLSLWKYPNFNAIARLVYFPPNKFDVDGAEYNILLRNKRVYKPYSLKLLKFEHAKYSGTEIAKDFASTVQVLDPADGVDREARIYMNNPLRYRDSSFYQLQVLLGDSGTVLQVVKNPARWLPYVACAMVSGGLLIHFGIMLINHLRRQRRQAARNTGPEPTIVKGPAVDSHDAFMPRDGDGSRSGGSHSLLNYLPLAVVLLALAWVGMKAIPPKHPAGKVDDFAAGHVPVMHNGRLKPLDTVARTTLQAISGRSEVQDIKADGSKETTASAMQWYFDVFDNRILDYPRDLFKGKAAEHKIFRIDNDQVLSLLELKPRPQFYRYSLKDLEPTFTKLMAELDKIEKKGEKKHDKRDSKLMELGKELRLYVNLARGEQIHLVPPQADSEDWRKLQDIDRQVKLTDAEFEAADTKARRSMVEGAVKEKEVLDALLQAARRRVGREVEAAINAPNIPAENKGRFRTLLAALQGENVELAPADRSLLDNLVWRTAWEIQFPEPQIAGLTREDLQKMPREEVQKLQRQIAAREEADEAVQMLARRNAFELIPGHRGEISPAAAAVTGVLRNAHLGNAAEFSQGMESYRNDYLGRMSESQKRDIVLETWFNHFAPFNWCAYLYVMVVILACLSWLVWRDPLNNAAFWLCVMTFVLHTGGLIVRMYLQGRPPVTNLYSSSIFIGWGCVLVCMILERYFRNGIGNVVGAALGALTMMMAHLLSETSGDTIEQLVAVLDTDFWLATHVTMVTLGYMATFVAGFIAVLYVLGGVFTKAIDAPLNKSFGQMIYGVICFAVFLSFTGTVLGGLWADYSWGRFWGWDSKENGAVMVVIWNVLILHARWAGLIKLRGVAVCALVGNMITMWSWFGTNQLQVGLHSYGFSSKLAERCMWVWLGSLPLIALGAILPTRYWRSFSDDTVRERASLTAGPRVVRGEAGKKG